MDADTEEMGADFALESTCIRGEACHRKQGRFCADNCIWMHFVGERHPRCFGLFQGRGLVPAGTPEAALTSEVCGRCEFELDCIVETGRRFGLDEAVVEKLTDEASEKYY